MGGETQLGNEAVLAANIDKVKSRAWRICKCGTGWTLTGLIMAIIGVILLVYYAKYWSDKDHWERGLAYTGLAFFLIGLFVMVVGILFCVSLFWIYQRINGPQKSNYKPPHFAPGTQPYPVQPTMEAAAQQQPLNQGAQPTAPSDVKVEVEERTNF